MQPESEYLQEFRLRERTHLQPSKECRDKGKQTCDKKIYPSLIDHDQESFGSEGCRNTAPVECERTEGKQDDEGCQGKEFLGRSQFSKLGGQDGEKKQQEEWGKQ